MSEDQFLKFTIQVAGNRERALARRDEIVDLLQDMGMRLSMTANGLHVLMVDRGVPTVGDAIRELCGEEWSVLPLTDDQAPDDYDPGSHLVSECRIGGCVGCETIEYRQGKDRLTVQGLGEFDPNTGRAGIDDWGS